MAREADARAQEVRTDNRNDNALARQLAPSLKRSLSRDEPRSRDAIKRRSSRACQTCRARKVRCDITFHGSPCTNCRLDNMDCILLVSKRGRKPRSPDVGEHAIPASRPPPPPQQPRPDQRPHLQSDLSYQHYQHHQQEEEEHEDGEGGEQAAMAPLTPLSSSRDSRAAAIPDSARVPERAPLRPVVSTSNSPAGKIYEVAVGLTFDHDADDGEGHSNENAADDGDDAGWRAIRSLHATSISHAGVSSVADASAASTGGLDSTLSLLNGTFPSFIRPLPNTIPDDDLAFLARKGALTLPEPELRDEIIRCYVNAVHPFMPILEMKRFLTAITSNDPADQISLLLFQAVMFAGLSALDPQLVQRYGFQTTKHARQAFFARVRLLHDFDVELDRVPLLQALLLMSLWYGDRNERKNTWHYTGLALSLAQNMGIHREPAGSHHEQRLRSRLWWSLYVRDRLIALGTRRPMRIRDDEHDVTMLSLQDFDCEPLDESLARFYMGGRSAQDFEQEKCLALMCIELVKLCVCIGHVLSAQYTTLGRRSLWTKALMVVPKQDLESPAAASELERCDQELADWYQSLHPEVSKVARCSASESTACHATKWHWTVVDMLRTTLVSLRHRVHGFRPLPANGASSDKSTTDLFKASKAKLKAAARDVTRLAHSMLQNDQIRYLPTSGVPALLSATLTHLLDLEAQDEDLRDLSMYRFSQTMQALQQLRGIYASADSAVTYLGMVIRKTGINMRVPAVAAIVPEFSCAMPTGSRNPSMVMTTEPNHHHRTDSMASSKQPTAAVLPCAGTESRPDGNADFGLPRTLLSASDAHISQQAPMSTLSPKQGHHSAKSQAHPIPLAAREFDVVGTPDYLIFRNTPLPTLGGDTSVVGMMGGGGDGLHQKSGLIHDTLFGLSGLDYDIDSALFSSHFNFYDDDLQWPEDVG